MVNYNATMRIMGGHLADYPEPHIRRWPGDPEKRKVTVTITRYYGYGEHYFVSIEEEANTIWDEAKAAWVQCWDDKEGKGLTDTHLYINGLIDRPGEIESYAKAKALAEAAVAKYFPDHEVVWEDYCKDWEKMIGREQE